MKKVFFVFLSLVTFSAFSQNKFKEIDPTEYSLLDKNEVSYKTFSEKANGILSEKGLSIENEINVGISPNQKTKIIVGKIIGSKDFNFVVAIMNVKSNELVMFIEKFVSDKNQINSVLYDDQFVEIYKTVQVNTSIKIIKETKENNGKLSKAANGKNLVPPTCFRTCISNQEDNFEDTWTGWGAWNLPPHSVVVQSLAAAECVGCCNGWWDNAGCH